MYMYKECWCIAQFKKNETAAMFFLKKPSLVSFLVSPTKFFRIEGGKKIKIKNGNPLNINLAENF